VVSWLVRSSPDGAVWVRALAGHVIVFLATNFTITVPLSNQVCKWVPQRLASHSVDSRITTGRFKLHWKPEIRPVGSLDSYADDSTYSLDNLN